MNQKSNNNKTVLVEKEETLVSLSLPDEISIEMVQANELRHYEIFNILVGLFTSSAVGFWTAAVGQVGSTLKWIAGVFTLFAFVFALIAIYYRRKVFHGSIKRVVKISDFK